MNGTIKFYNTDRGYGFITPESGGRDTYVHASILAEAGIRDLAEGQKVTYEVVSGQDGRDAAANLQLT